MSNIDLSDICHGLWWTIHDFGKHSIKDADKKFYIDFLNRLCNQFPCSICKEHFIEMLEEMNPYIPVYWNMKHEGIEIGMFRFSWLLHNRVNERLNKAVLSWDDACRIYYPDKYGIDYKPCGGSI